MMPLKPGTGLNIRRLLLALLSDVAEDKNFQRCFKAGHRDIHVFFWKLSQDETTKPFVARLLFDTNGNYPHSLQIDELLQELQLSGLLARPNPTYRYNDIKFSKRPYGKELKQDLSENQQQVYDGIVKEFKEELCERAKV
ncbi:MAG: hypothetical protein ACLQPD_01030 [Desulfomonilaceae bacterium]